MAKLAATIRTVTHAHCSGPNVPGFWKGLNFSLKYQHYKRGHIFDIQRGPWVVHVLASKMHRVGSTAGDVRNGPTGKEVVVSPGDEIAPNRILIEVWVDVGSGSHTDAIAAVVDIGKLLAPEGVVLQPLPDSKGRPQGPQSQV